ncbi:DegT/DnrJ/EryC1/StrS family aminotransferase [Pyrococcus furiosus DSM 3638]|uniref:Pleiotropic regulatory protein degT n=3 Tax=Pyrococcus furiosus TaxID=2261 RepID=Q8U2R5_PYRFU|nr:MULTISPECIES: DegT/DnrJ/EryC1/StrS family aminotransferase [Pyrococcus]AAL80891.1 pleiotropic regulatory protein degT [Pyrococcus furiosus DSM 3638]AFN03551.1 pleiotropic regulatory protein degT [Pyrococcus furiosus COM1]MDK2870480.1 perosamine synthetase [Pyrococcus sp.]QEK78447.1 DegT/DnrJ/EryC1/StrS family aminotransferase [Pyrococcus furiosus DSM 3638]
MIPIAKPLIGEEEINAVIEVLKSGMLAHGKEVEAFEREFASYIGVKHGIAVVNGTAALDIALKALKIKPGDEIITTPFTFIASANAILFQGAKPVFADIDPKTYNLDPDEVLEKINEKTKAIIVVHLYGQPADMKAFKEIAEDYKLYLIEDCAQAHGAEFEGQKVGTFGDIAAFSFYPTKNMTTGEGGMVLTNDDELARRARLIRNHGQTEKYLHEELGYNLRMTNIAAALGRVQLRKLDKWNEIRIENAELLTKGIKRIKGLTPPYVDKRVKHVFHQYVIRVEDDFPLTRDELREKLMEKGIGTAVHYPMPVHHQPLYQRLGYSKDCCPNAIEASKRVLSLPVHPAVSKEDINYIIRTLEELG